MELKKQKDAPAGTLTEGDWPPLESRYTSLEAAGGFTLGKPPRYLR